MKNVGLAWVTLFFISVISFDSKSQQNSAVAIGKNQSQDNAVLLLYSPGKNQGLIIPVGDRTTIPSPQEGMIVFDTQGKCVYYYSGSQWVSLGNTGTNSNFQIDVQGNEIQLLNGTTIISNAPLSSSPPSSGDFLIWNGSAWVSSSLKGDVSSVNGTVNVTGLLGKGLPTLPVATQALVYNGATWSFQSLPANTSLTGAAPLIVSNGTQISITQSGTIQDGYLSSTDWNSFNNKLGVGTVAGGDLSGMYPNPTVDAIQGIGVATTIPTNGQVLKWNSVTSLWEPQPDNDSGAGFTLTASTPLSVSNGTQITIAQSGTAQDGYLSSLDWNTFNDKLGTGSTAGGDLSGTYPNPTVSGLQGWSVSPVVPNNGQVLKWSDLDNQWEPQDDDATTLAGGDLSGFYPNPVVSGIQGIPVSSTIPTNGQMLKWDQTTNQWEPKDDDIGTGTIPILNDGEVILGDGTTNFRKVLGGDATIDSSTGTLTISTNAVTTGKINDNAVTTNKVLDNAITNSKIASVSASKITGITDTYVARGTNGGNSLTSSQLRDDGSTLAIGSSPQPLYKFRIFNFTTVNGLDVQSSFPTSSDATGISCVTSGSSSNNIGINARANNANNATAYGLKATGIGATSADCYGVYGTATSTGTNYAVYGDTYSGTGTNNYSGYFKSLANPGASTVTGVAADVFAATASAATLTGISATIDKQNTEMGTGYLFKASYVQTPPANLDTRKRYGLHVTNEQYNYLSNRLQVGGTNNDGYGNLQVMQGTDPSTEGIWLTDGTRTYSFWIDAASQNLTLRKNGVGMIGSFDNTTGAYTNVSDVNRKKEVAPLGSVLSRLSQLKPSQYLFKEQSSDSEKNIGFIAQEVKEVFPSLVKYNDHDKIYSLDYSGFSVIAIKAIQEQQELIEQQAHKIESLEEQLNEMSTKLDRLISSCPSKSTGNSTENYAKK